MHLKRTCLFLVLIAFVLAGAYAQAESPSPVGTWQVIVTPDTGTPSLALLTLNSDHNLIATSNSELGVTQGVWTRNNSLKTFTVQGFQWEFDPFNVFDGGLETSATFTIDSNGHLTGRFQVEFHDPTGALVFTQTGSWTGLRIPSTEEPGPGD